MIKVFDRCVFGKEALRLLGALHQSKRSVADYAIEFRILAVTSRWNPEALPAQFLDGLVDDIKYEIYARDPPEHLDNLIDLAIYLDSRMELRHRVRCQAIRHRSELPDFSSAPQVSEASVEEEPMQIGRMHLSAKDKDACLKASVCTAVSKVIKLHLVQ